MIKSIISGIFKLVISLVNLLLSPIDSLIAKFLPSLSSGIDKVSAFFNWVAGLIPWGISWFGFDDAVISLFVAYMTFELTVPILIHTIKLALKWYNKLKP